MKILAVESGTTTISLNLGVNVLYEKQTVGHATTINDYVYADGLLIAKLTGNSVLYYHQDQLGNTRLVTSGTTTSFSSNYQPYGAQYCSTGSDPVYKYTGKPQSAAIGLYYYGARWYNSTLGRFLTRDPNPGRLTNPQSLNLYIYVLNNPLRYTDPTGRDSCWIFSSICDAAASGANTLWNAGSNYVNSNISALNVQYNAAVYEWNHDANFRTIILSVALIAVVTVATGGLGLAATPILLGALGGGSLSGAFYMGTCGSKCSIEGAAAAILSGVALGALGGAAGPVAGGLSSELISSEIVSTTFGGFLSRAIPAGIAGGSQLAVDAAGGKSAGQTIGDVIIAGGFAALTGSGTVANPSSFTDAAAQISDRFLAGGGGRDLLEGLGSTGIGGFFDSYISPYLPF